MTYGAEQTKWLHTLAQLQGCLMRRLNNGVMLTRLNLSRQIEN